MKKIILSITVATTLSGGFLASTAFAQAATIDLYTTAGFGALHQYSNVANSAGVAISLYLPQSSTNADGLLYLDGVQFTCPNMTAWPAQNVPLTYQCVDPNTGASLVLTIAETWYRKQINSGRAHYWVTRWTLQSGTLESTVP